MKWLKRYAVSCLVAMFLFACLDGYSRPGKDMRIGAIVATAVVWPVFTAIVLGSSIGEVASKHSKVG